MPVTTGPYVFTDDETRRLFSAIDSPADVLLLEQGAGRPGAVQGALRHRAAGLEALHLKPGRRGHRRGDVADPRLQNGQGRTIPITARLAAAQMPTARPRTRPVSHHHLFYSRAAGSPINRGERVCEVPRLPRHDAGIPTSPAAPTALAAPRLAVPNLRRWAANGADLAVMLPYLACCMGYTDLRGTRYYLRLTADAYPTCWPESGPVRLRHPHRPRTSDEPPAHRHRTWRALAGKFFTDYLAGQRSYSPRTIASYRDAIKLLLLWLRDGDTYHRRNYAWRTSTGPGCYGSWTG